MIKVKNINESYTALIAQPPQLKLRVANLLKTRVKNYQYDPRFKSGQWDGYKKFYSVKNNYLIYPKGFTNLIKDFCMNSNIKFEEVNPTHYDYDEDDINTFIESLNLDFELRDYQRKTIHLTLKNGRGVYELATGSGKSVIQAIILTYLWYKYNIKSVLIVPNVSLVEQFYSDFLDYFKNYDKDITEILHKIYSGLPKHFDKPITITTWQSVYKSEELFEDIGCIITDEVHRAKNYESKLADIIIPSSLNAKYKLGFTGTIPKDRVEQYNLIGSFGEIKTIVKAKDLIEMGYGTPIEIILMNLKYPKKFCTEIRKQNYQKEKKIFETLDDRNDYIVKLARKVSEKFGNTLILFDRIEHGYTLVEKLTGGKFIPKLTNRNANLYKDKKIFLNTITDKEQKIIDKYNLDVKTLEDEKVFFIYGEVDANIREEIRKKTEELDNIIIVANYQTFSTGVNIKNLHNLILASSTKKFETLVQSLGRTIRKHKLKNKVRVFDIIDNCSTGFSDNYLYKHFKERLAVYIEEGHKLKENNISIDINDKKINEIFNIKDEEIVNNFF